MSSHFNLDSVIGGVHELPEMSESGNIFKKIDTYLGKN